MTKQEYEAKVLSLKGTHDYNMLCFIRGEYIESLEAENTALTLLHTQATDEMLKMQNRVHKLEAEIALLASAMEEAGNDLIAMAQKPLRQYGKQLEKGDSNE